MIEIWGSGRIDKVDKMAQQAKVFVDKLDGLNSIPEPTWWKGRTDSHKFINRARTLPSCNAIHHIIMTIDFLLTLTPLIMY